MSFDTLTVNERANVVFALNFLISNHYEARDMRFDGDITGGTLLPEEALTALAVRLATPAATLQSPAEPCRASPALSFELWKERFKVEYEGRTLLDLDNLEMGDEDMRERWAQGDNYSDLVTEEISTYDMEDMEQNPWPDRKWTRPAEWAETPEEPS